MGADMVENRKKVAGMSRLSPDASCRLPYHGRVEVSEPRKLQFDSSIQSGSMLLSWPMGTVPSTRVRNVLNMFIA